MIKEIEVNLSFIPLTQEQIAVVDTKDFDYLNQCKWYAGYSKDKDDCYAKRTKHLGVVDGAKKHRVIQMHREVIKRKLTEEKRHELLKQFKKNPRKFPVDHINHNTLKNTRDNLRIVSHRQNIQNHGKRTSSKYPGVSKYRNGKWQSMIKIEGKLKHLGYFKTEEKAFEAYKNAVKELTGEKVVSIDFNVKDLVENSSK